MRTILVIDDNQEILDTLALILESEGYSVMCSSEPNRALKICEEVNFDLVICDLYMPSDGLASLLAGVEVIAQLREQFPTLPVLAMSGMLDTDSLERMTSAGATSVVSKPFIYDNLIDKISVLLRPH